MLLGLKFRMFPGLELETQHISRSPATLQASVLRHRKNLNGKIQCYDPLQRGFSRTGRAFQGLHCSRRHPSSLASNSLARRTRQGFDPNPSLGIFPPAVLACRSNLG